MFLFIINIYVKNDNFDYGISMCFNIFIHVYESQLYPVLPQQDGVDVNLNMICFEPEIDRCHVEG